MAMLLLAIPGAAVVATFAWVLTHHLADRGKPDLGCISGQWMAEFAQRSESASAARR